jgi:hypothetical protein
MPLTPAQKTSMMKSIFKTIFSHEVKLELPPRINMYIKGGKPITWKLANGLRGYKANIDGKEIVIMEQNPASYSEGALLAKWKFNCCWIWHQKKPWPSREREWIAFLIQREDGKILIFAGKHIMTRVYYHMRPEIEAKKDRIMNKR